MLAHHFNPGQALAKIIVQVLPDPPLLPVADLQDFPLLFAVSGRSLAEVANHLVEVVSQSGHFAPRLDADGLPQIACSDGPGNLGDGAHLGRQI